MRFGARPRFRRRAVTSPRLRVSVFRSGGVELVFCPLDRSERSSCSVRPRFGLGSASVRPRFGLGSASVSRSALRQWRQRRQRGVSETQPAAPPLHPQLREQRPTDTLSSAEAPLPSGRR
ncbi:hypothetical protein MHYP_G00251530 [Metynnis hypsauchen]